MRSNRLRMMLSAGTLALALGMTGCASSSENSNQSTSNETTTESNTKSEVEKETAFSSEMAEMWTVRLDDMKYTQSEYYLYLIQYLFNHGYTEKDITEQIKTSAIDSTVYQMRLDALEYAAAQKDTDISVTDEKLKDKEKAAESFYKFFGADFLGEYFITEDMVKELFKKQTYVAAYDDKLLTDISKEYYADFEKKYKDYTFHNMYYVLFPTYEMDENGKIKKDADGNIIKISEEAKSELMAKAEELQKRALDGEKMEDLAKEYGVDKYSDTEINIDGAYSEQQNALVESLSDGQISDVVETETGFMIVRMNKKQDDNYKVYWMQYMAYSQAQGAISQRQQEFVKNAKLDEKDVNDYVVMNTDLINVCKRMAAYGVTNEKPTEAETTK